jgi:HD superfamily phosphohydrolase
LTSGKVEEFHERISLSIIKQLHKERLLTNNDLAGIENVLIPGALGKNSPNQQNDQPPIRNICRDIVSGPFDADKMDYLLRDSRYAGVLYGVYDLHRLAHGATLIEEKPNSYLGIKEENISALDQFIIANHNMRIQVYGHRIRRIADLMLVRSVVASISDGNKTVKKLFEYHNDEDFVRRYVKVDDAELVKLVMTGRDGNGKKIMERLINRRLPKEVLEVPLTDITDAELAEKLSDKNAESETTGELETKLAKKLRLKKDNFVFVEVRRDRPIRAMKGEAPIDPSAIMVELRKGGTKSYDQVSRFFRQSGFSDRDYLSVWATLDEPDRERREVIKGDYYRTAADVLSIKESKNDKTGS